MLSTPSGFAERGRRVCSSTKSAWRHRGVSGSTAKNPGSPPAESVTFVEPLTSLCRSVLTCGLPGTMVQREGQGSTVRRRPGTVHHRGAANPPGGAEQRGRASSPGSVAHAPPGRRGRPRGRGRFSVSLYRFNFAEWETHLHPGLGREAVPLSGRSPVQVAALLGARGRELTGHASSSSSTPLRGGPES